MPLSSACQTAECKSRRANRGAAWAVWAQARHQRGSILAGLVLIAGIQPALAIGCKQANAVYGDRDGAYELRFQAVGSAAAAASNQFKLGVKASSVEMEGFVMPSDDPVRANAIIMFNCPEGDTTGEQLDACTIWQGPIYAVDATGGIANLAPEGDMAAVKLLLPGIGSSIRDSSLWESGKATVAPWDVLVYGGCAE